MKKIIKRNGTLAKYDPIKIKNAIEAANNDIGNPASKAEVEVIYETSKKEVENILTKKNVSVEDVNDIVERTMMRYGCHDLAKQFIEYRFKHKVVRDFNTTDKEIFELIGGNSDYWNNENSNKDARKVTTQRVYMAGITNTDIARRFIFSKESVKAHDDGIIHIHDIDYAADNVRNNCCLVNLHDMLQNGTVLNGIKIDRPHRFITSCTIATQIILAVSASQYGGVTVTLSHLAPFVRESYNRYFKKYLERGLSEEQAKQFADEDTRKEVKDGVQTFNYQVNSMASSNGQSPFISVNMYLNETDEYKDELALIIEEFLKQRIEGMKNPQGVWITVAFPKLLYVLEEDNIRPGTKYWYLTELAARCTAKRLVPDYISEKMMKQLKVNKFGYGDCYPCMGKCKLQLM